MLFVPQATSYWMSTSNSCQGRMLFRGPLPKMESDTWASIPGSAARGRTCAYSKYCTQILQFCKVCNQHSFKNENIETGESKKAQTRCVFCRSRSELAHEYLLANAGFDTAESEPLKVLGRSSVRQDASCAHPHAIYSGAVIQLQHICQ